MFSLRTAAVPLISALLVPVTGVWTHAPAASAPHLVASADVRLVAAPTAVTDQQGQTWQPDASFAVGGRISPNGRPISGTSDQGLFSSLRYGMSGYRIPVAPGSYTVTLNLAEHYWTAKGRRVFSVSAEGRTVESNVDVVGAVGAFSAEQLSFTVPVTDGTLNLGFAASKDYAMVSSLSVTAAGAASTNYVTPESFGAVGNGTTDDTVALQQAFDAATAATPVLLAAGKTYAHSDLLYLRVAGEHLTGSGTLLATNEQRSSVWIQADRVLVDGGMTITLKSSTQRWSAWEQMGVRIDGHSGITLRNITISKSAAAGLYVGGAATGFVLDHVTVANTRADGIHMTEGVNHGQVIAPTVQDSGDDGVAIVSYSSDGAPCSDITVTSPHVLGTAWGRGLSVVGGVNITETDIEVQRSDAAGVYIAAEGNPWYSTAPQNVSFTGGSITGANTDTGIDHGAVLVLAGENGITPSHVTVSGLTISNTRSTASRNIGVVTYGTAPSAILFSNLTITGGPSGAYGGNTPQTSYELRNIMQNGHRLADAG